MLAKSCITAVTLLGLTAFAALADPPPPDKPLLWRVEGNGLAKPSHLFGTIHLSNDRIAQLHPAASRALDESDAFYAEISLNMPEQIANAALLMRRDGRKLSASIGPEITRQLNDRLQEIRPGLDISILEPMKTWAAAMVVVMLPYQLEGKAALDQILWNRAKTTGKTVGALEKAEDQLSAFDSLNEGDQVIYLRETLELLDEGKQLVDRMIASYESGDEALLEKIIHESIQLGGEDPKSKEIGDRLIHALITERDVTIADKIHEILSQNPDESNFFAVGAAHYLGDESIRKHLSTKGYTITRIKE